MFVLMLCGCVHLAGIRMEAGTIMGQTVLYLEHWEMYLESEFEMAEDAIKPIIEIAVEYYHL